MTRTAKLSAPSIVSASAPGPTMFTEPEITGRFDPKVIGPATFAKLIRSEPGETFEASIASRRLPASLSAFVVTTMSAAAAGLR